MELTIAQAGSAPATSRYRWTPRVVAQLTVLGVAAYVYTLAEMAPIGAMASMASDLDVSEARVGLLTAVYALITVLSTVPLARWTAHWPRRLTFVLTLVCLTVSQALSVIAPGLGLLAASRVLCALAHGLMWAVIVPIAARLVPPSHTARATTAVYIGTSAALIVGNPLTTSMSQLWGWRTAVAVIAVAAAVVTVAARVVLPALEPVAATDMPVSARGGVYRNRGLITLCLLTLIGVTAHFASFTFIVPILRDVVGVGGAGQGWVLAGYGLAGLITLAVFGRAMDHRLRAVAIGSSIILCAAFWTLGGLATLAIGTMALVPGVLAVVVWGAAAAALPPMLQSAAIRTSPDQPEQASALYVTCFQVGIMTGSVAGAVVYQASTITAVIATSCVLFAGTLVGVLARGEVFDGLGARVSR
jgi:predicted MFS family arabinose efflux permease